MANVLLISYDNGSHIPYFPMNLFYLAGALKHAKHTVGIWFQDIHHGGEEALTEILDKNPFNVVGLGFVAGYYPYGKAKKISEAINKSKRRKEINYCLGGHGPGGSPEFFIRKMEADTVVIGDGENAILEIAQGKKGIIQGVPSSRDEAPLDCYELFPMMVYRLLKCPTSNRTEFCMPILSSRGCKWNCSFCYRMREGYHERSIEAIMEEIKFLHENYQITHFDFADELLMSSEKRTVEICEALLNLSFKVIWDCNGRLNFGELKLLMLMKSAGCSYVNYGIESLNQTILNQMGKGLTVDRITEGVEDSLKAGLSPGLNFIWGFPGDTEKNLWKCVDFLKKYDPCDELRTIRPVTPYPGCRLFKEAVEKGLVKDAEDFYENKHKNSDLISVNFMDMPTEKAHMMLLRANRMLLENYYMKRLTKTVSSAADLYISGDTSFRGFRTV